jgi:hypothetical protein
VRTILVDIITLMIHWIILESYYNIPDFLPKPASTDRRIQFTIDTK